MSLFTNVLFTVYVQFSNDYVTLFKTVFYN